MHKAGAKGSTVPHARVIWLLRLWNLYLEDSSRSFSVGLRTSSLLSPSIVSPVTPLHPSILPNSTLTDFDSHSCLSSAALFVTTVYNFLPQASNAETP